MFHSETKLNCSTTTTLKVMVKARWSIVVNDISELSLMTFARGGTLIWLGLNFVTTLLITQLLA